MASPTSKQFLLVLKNETPSEADNMHQDYYSSVEEAITNVSAMEPKGTKFKIYQKLKTGYQFIKRGTVK